MASMKDTKILISWLGDSDIRNFTEQSETAEKSGPLHSILTDTSFGPFQELWLFKTPMRLKTSIDTQEAVTKLKAFCKGKRIKMELINAPKNFDVANMDEIYNFMFHELLKKRENKGKIKARYYYNLTSGTPAMYAIQLYLSGVRNFQGTPLYTIPPFLQKSHETNVREAHLPSALAVLETNSGQEKDLYDEPNRKVFEQVRLKVATTDASVLIQGETGTGKSALARYIHKYSKRAQKEMVEVNCAALGSDINTLLSEIFGHAKGAFTGADRDREGAFQRANGSTLFLDEIGEIPFAHQGTLLRALAESSIKPLGSEKEIKVDVRIIAATNVDLPRAVREGKFRADLFYRLAQYAPVLKPLREYSREQREGLLDSVLREINNRRYFSHPRVLTAEAKKILLAYPWPGNIREMKYRLESICLLSDMTITKEDVSEQLTLEIPIVPSPDGAGRPSLPDSDSYAERDIPHNLKDWLIGWEKFWIGKALENCKTEADAASRIGMKKSTFSSRKKTLGLA